MDELMPDEGEELEELSTLRGQALVDALVKRLIAMGAMIGDLQRDVDALRVYQQAKQNWLATDSLIDTLAPLPRFLEVDATHLLPAQAGFFPVEYTGDGLGFRWTGPSSNFAFDVFIDRTSGAELHLHTLGCVDLSLQQPSIMLRVDGEPVPVEVAKKHDRLTIAARLPPSEQKCSSHLEFAAQTMTPSNDDTRLLGLKFVKLCIRATGANNNLAEVTAEVASPATAVAGRPRRMAAAAE